MKTHDLQEHPQNTPISPAPSEPDIRLIAEMASRFVDAHQELSLPGEEEPPHVHPFYELVYCTAGSIDYLVGTEHYHVNRGDLISIPPGVIHGSVSPEQSAESCRRYVLWLSQEFTQIYTSLFPTEGIPDSHFPSLFRTAGTAPEYISDSFRQCVQECEQRHFRWEAAVFGIATELCVQLARSWQGNQVEDKPELLDRILSHVEAHLAEKITLPDIAARFWVSQSTISQLFRKKMGTSFYRYVTLRRLTEAKTLIRTGIPMDQISIAVGFQDYSTFYRAFKAEFSISPAQYRKMH